MDPNKPSDFLSQIYGTFGATKTAAQTQQTTQDDIVTLKLQALDKIASAGGQDISKLSEDQLQALVEGTTEEELANALNEMGTAASEGEMTDVEKEAMAKLAQWDFNGRVAAHALWNEIEKIAAAQAEAEGAQAQAPNLVSVLTKIQNV